MFQVYLFYFRGLLGSSFCRAGAWVRQRPIIFYAISIQKNIIGR